MPLTSDEKKLLVFYSILLVPSIIHSLLSSFFIDEHLLILAGIPGLSVYWSNMIDIHLYITLLGPTYIALSFFGSILPLLISLTLFIHTEKTRLCDNIPIILAIMFLSTVSFLLFHIVGDYGVSAGFSIIPIIILQLLFVQHQSGTRDFAIALSVYWSTFFSFLPGDIIVRYTDNLSSLTVVGGASFSDGLWTIPALLSFAVFLILGKNAGNDEESD